MEDFALIKSRVNLNRVNQGITLISDIKVIISHNLKSDQCQICEHERKLVLKLVKKMLTCKLKEHVCKNVCLVCGRVIS